ncbi:hypothetical protein NOVO_04180 [Rickettsiales bacterium Ac37b]|nr:hypothetical protein NOVO_04180 [Rickettsiales bacterium Ac37b]
MNDARKQHYFLGIVSEKLAVLFLKFKLYRVIATRVRNKFGEIDIIAYKNNTLIFIEVKLRTSAVYLYEAITYKQKKRITRAATLFSSTNMKFINANMRFNFHISL